MKRSSLADNVKAAAFDEQPIVSSSTRARVLVPESTAAEAKRGSREGRKAAYAWLDPAEHKKLKHLSFDTGKSIDTLVTEAVQLLFAKHGV